MAPKWSLLLLLLLLSNCPWARPGASSVCYNFTITTYEYTWCEFGGQVNGSTFLRYTCSHKAECDCQFLSTMGNVTKTCSVEKETLKDMMEKFKMILPEMKPKNSRTNNLHTLKGEMTCQWEANGPAYGIWYFYLNGNKALLFDSKNGNQTVLSPEGEQLNTLNKEKEVYEFLKKNSDEMCVSWPKKMRNQKDNALNTTDPVTSKRTTEPPTRSPATNLSKTTIFICVIVPSIVFGLGIFGFYRYRKRLCGQRARKKPPSGGCVGQDEEASILRTPEIPGELSGSQSPDSQLPADWRQRSTEGLCLEQRPATQTGSPVSCVSLSDSDL
ncbi:UL16-binding protein 1-like isoform X2 [Pteropus medius]|uniref:UL16-binding protein 1-like isoform X2 n=1 Tax=Pteropus vampyrus TaxID=132908 RepID=UPI00196A69E3|nr:UL16-binding protein 1-like isoform X2 [Pteropus giganteus]